MAKTYVPTLRLMVHNLSVYMVRWQALIEGNLSPEQITAFRDCLACITSLVAALGAEPIDE